MISKIIEGVKDKGDEALTNYTRKFDGEDFYEVQDIPEIDPDVKNAIIKAAERIRRFAEYQMRDMKGFEYEDDGILLGQRLRPIEKVGCYVPGGLYPLPSSALMSIIPAKVAGVKEVIVCSPKIRPETIVAAKLAGADRIFSLGGAQAIAAMAYGTETIPQVDKIVGPGNRYVSEAKRQVYGCVGIDFIAGPSEVLIIADETGDGRLIAADLLAQAEHDTNAIPNLLTTSRRLAQEVKEKLTQQLDKLETKDTAKIALENGFIKVVDTLEEACRISDEVAPEHLELQMEEDLVKDVIDKLNNFGSLFIGKYSAEVFGDYCSGPNHILPTSGAARYTAGLSVKDFVRFQTYQKISKKGAKLLTPIAETLAKAEGLDGHRKAAARDIY